jgi:hypothetical protein
VAAKALRLYTAQVQLSAVNLDLHAPGLEGFDNGGVVKGALEALKLQQPRQTQDCARVPIWTWTEAHRFESRKRRKSGKVPIVKHGDYIEAAEVRELCDAREARHVELAAFAIPEWEDIRIDIVAAVKGQLLYRCEMSGSKRVANQIVVDRLEEFLAVPFFLVPGT